MTDVDNDVVLGELVQRMSASVSGSNSTLGDQNEDHEPCRDQDAGSRRALLQAETQIGCEWV